MDYMEIKAMFLLFKEGRCGCIRTKVPCTHLQWFSSTDLISTLFAFLPSALLVYLLVFQTSHSELLLNFYMCHSLLVFGTMVLLFPLRETPKSTFLHPSLLHTYTKLFCVFISCSSALVSGLSLQLFLALKTR